MGDKKREKLHKIFETFHDSNEQKTKILSYHFAAAMNLKYNCGIHLDGEDLENIIKAQINKWVFDPKRGWNLRNSFNEILNYIEENKKTRKWEVPKLHKFSSESHQWEKHFKRWYALMLWFWIKGNFYWELCSWKLDEFIHYNQHFWSSNKHLLNVVKIMETVNLLDTFMHWEQKRDSLVECNLKKTVEYNIIKHFYCFI